MSGAARVLIVTQYYWPEVGAPQVRYAAVTRALVKRGVEVEVLTGLPNYPTGRIHAGYSAWRPQVEMHEGARIHRLPLFAYGGQVRRLRLLNHASFAGSAFAGVLMDLRPDVVVVESPPLPLVPAAAAIARRHRVPLVMYCADLWPGVPLAMGALRPGFLADRLRDLESLCYRWSWRITANSDGIYETLAGHPDAGPAKLMLLRNGADTSVFRPYEADECHAERSRLGQIGRRALFVFAGTIGPVQALDTLLDAAAMLRADRRIGFVILGDGPERKRLEAKTAALGLDNVLFLGSVPADEVARYLALARATVVPLHDLALFSGVRSAKLMPSLACARPVIFAGRGEMAALLEGEDCGVVVAPENPGALASAVVRLTDDPLAARAMGERGRAFALRDYDFDALVGRWWDELGAALRARRDGKGSAAV